MQFLVENVWVIGLAIGSGVMLLMPMLKPSAVGVKEATPSEAVLLINRQHALVLDVRDDSEYETGSIPDAKHIQLADLEAKAETLRKYQNKPILVTCQAGVRGGKACAALQKLGFTEVTNLKGGLEAWKQANLPIIRA